MEYNTKITSVKKAFEYLNLDIKALPEVSKLPARFKKFITAAYKLTVVIEALNKEANGGKTWKPDWSNGQWDKYHNWFEVNGAGSGFSDTDYVDWRAVTHVGSRLCFCKSETATYAANHKEFRKLYEDYLLYT